MASLDHGLTPSDDHRHAITQADALLRDEFGQAWQHYRHLEVLRGQYIGFAFTVTFASLALTVPLIASSPQVGSITLPIGAFLLFYGLFVGSLYLNVRKIRFLLAHYQKVLEDVRAYFYDHIPNLDFDVDGLNVLRVDHPLIRSRLFRSQTTSESILAMLLIVATGTQMIFIIVTLRAHPQWWHVVIMLAMGAGIILIATCVLSFAWRHRRDPHADQPQA